MGGDNYQKVPVARALNQWAGRRVRSAIQLTGRALPCEIVSVQGWIVTVKFLLQQTPNCPFTIPNITVPVASAEYDYIPYQAGDKGVVMPVDAYLGGISGLGGGAADLNPRANLTCLMFFPCGNKAWTPDDANARVIWGPDGVILRTQNKAVSLTVNGTNVTIQGSGTALALVTQAFEALFNGHTHPSNGAPPTQQMTSAQLTTILKAQ